MTTDEIRALEPNARRRLEEFRDCFKKEPVFDYLVSYSLGLMATLERKSIRLIPVTSTGKNTGWTTRKSWSGHGLARLTTTETLSGV